MKLKNTYFKFYPKGKNEGINIVAKSVNIGYIFGSLPVNAKLDGTKNNLEIDKLAIRFAAGQNYDLDNLVPSDIRMFEFSDGVLTYRMQCQVSLRVDDFFTILTLNPIQNENFEVWTAGEKEIIESGFNPFEFYPVGAVYVTKDEEFDPNIEWGGEWVCETRVSLPWSEQACPVKDGYLNTKNLPAIYQWVKVSMSGPNKIVYDGTEYSLADNIDPNLFCKNSPVNWPVVGGGTLKIENKGKVSELSIRSVTKGTTIIPDNFLNNYSKLEKLELLGFRDVTNIGKDFLYYCKWLSEVDLSQLKSLVRIESGFLYNCAILDEITVPFRQPPFVADKDFMLDVREDLVIHCGKYLEDYKKAPIWSLRKDYMEE